MLDSARAMRHTLTCWWLAAGVAIAASGVLPQESSLALVAVADWLCVLIGALMVGGAVAVYRCRHRAGLRAGLIIVCIAWTADAVTVGIAHPAAWLHVAAAVVDAVLAWQWLAGMGREQAVLVAAVRLAGE